MHPLIFEVNGHDFEAQVLNADVPVLIEFTADWCPPCKMLAPIVKEMAIKYEGKLRVAMLDSDANPDLTRQYNVMGLPTLMLFAGGLPIVRIVGFTPLERIEAKVLPYLAAESAG